jgi:hypothetical protein
MSLGSTILTRHGDLSRRRDYRSRHLTYRPEGLVPGSPWDLAVCCEVAEHLDARHADIFVENLTSASNTVFLTAAEVGQGGLNHVNEQPNSYWIAKFHRRGFTLDGNLTEKARAAFAGGEVVHYLAKPMIFRRVEK